MTLSDLFHIAKLSGDPEEMLERIQLKLEEEKAPEDRINLEMYRQRRNKQRTGEELRGDNPGAYEYITFAFVTTKGISGEGAGWVHRGDLAAARRERKETAVVCEVEFWLKRPEMYTGIKFLPLIAHRDLIEVVPQ